MKRLITLFFATASVAIVTAQTKSNNRPGYNKNDVAYTDRQAHPGNNNRPNTHEIYSLNAHEKKAMIRKIDREYDGKIAAVKRSRYLKSWEKNKRVSTLKNERDARIQQVKYGVSRRNNQDDHHRGGKW